MLAHLCNMNQVLPVYKHTVIMTPFLLHAMQEVKISSSDMVITSEVFVLIVELV